MAGKKPNIRRQDQIRQDSIETYKNPDTGAEVSSKTVRTHKTDRAIQKRRDNDNVKNFSVGIKDIDEAIFYYFNEILKPVPNGFFESFRYDTNEFPSAKSPIIKHSSLNCILNALLQRSTKTKYTLLTIFIRSHFCNTHTWALIIAKIGPYFHIKT